MAETWLPGVERQQGPFWKQGYLGIPRRPMESIEGEVNHSAEGSMAALLGEIQNLTRAASWTFSILKDGRVMQHYGIKSVTWHGGSRDANDKFVGIEHEGGFSPHDEPLTSMQVKSLTDLLAWLGDEFGWTEWKRQITLWEHNEMTRFGSAPTACPSGRIPWASLITELEKEDEVDQEARDAIKALEKKHAKDIEAIAARFTFKEKGDAAQNKLHVGAYGAIDFLSEIAVNHEKRVKKLEE